MESYFVSCDGLTCSERFPLPLAGCSTACDADGAGGNPMRRHGTRDAVSQKRHLMASRRDLRRAWSLALLGFIAVIASSLPSASAFPREGVSPHAKSLLPASSGPAKRDATLRLSGGGGEGVRLALRRKKGASYTNRKNKPVKRSRKNLGVVEQANDKISKHIHARIENIAAQRAGASGEKLKLAVRTQRSNMDRKMNMPSSQPGDKYVQKIRSLGGMGVRKGGSVGKSKRR